jgi:hypothetical protein
LKKAEELIEILEAYDKRWQDGDMRKRWIAAGKLVAEQQFRRILKSRSCSCRLARSDSPRNEPL